MGAGAEKGKFSYNLIMRFDTIQSETSAETERSVARARFRHSWRESLKPHLDAMGYTINVDLIPLWLAELEQAMPEILDSFDDPEIAADIKWTIATTVKNVSRDRSEEGQELRAGILHALIDIASQWVKHKQLDVIISSPENIRVLAILAEHGMDQDKKFVSDMINPEIAELILFDKNAVAGVELFIAMYAGGDSFAEERLRQVHLEFKQSSPLSAAHILGALIENGLPETSKLAINIVKEDLVALGLDAEKLLRVWNINGKSGQFTNDVVERNMERIYELSQIKLNQVEGKETENIPKFLFENFGIIEFERYPKEMLEQMHARFEDITTPYGIVIFPRIDNGEHAGAFAQDTQVLGNFFDQIKSKYNLRVVEAGSKPDLTRLIGKLDRKYGHENKISFALVGGHGTLSMIALGEGRHARDFVFKKDLEDERFKQKASLFVEHPTFILFSCSTGIEGGLAEKLSSDFNALVMAPDSDTSVRSVKADITDEDPSFDIEYGKGKTMVYDRGLLVHITQKAL